MHRKRLTAVAISAAITLLCACSNQSALHCRAGESLQVHDLLYFGTARGEHGQPAVTEEQWTDFLNRVLTPHFPDGLTILVATGQWKSGSGNLVREGSRVLSLVHPHNPNTEASIRAAIAAYKSEFDQDSVLRVRSTACVTFL